MNLTISQILLKLDTETSHRMLLALKVFKHTEPQKNLVYVRPLMVSSITPHNVAHMLKVNMENFHSMLSGKFD